MEDLRELQRSLELGYAEEGSLSYLKQYQQNNFSDTGIGGYLVGKALDDLEKAVVSWIQSQDAFKNNVCKAIYLCLPPKDIALITLRYLMDVAFSAAPGFRKSEFSGCVSSVSLQLGSHLINHLNFVVLRSKNKRAYDHMMDFLENKSYHYRRRTVAWYKEMLQHTEVKADAPDKAAVGYPCLKLAVETTGLFEVLPKMSKGGNLINMLYPSQQVYSNVISNLDKLSAMHPLLLPMICPPDPWTSLDSGGYLTIQRTPMITTFRHAQELWDMGTLGVRFDVLNRLGSIPWEIDRDMVSLMEEAYKNNHRSVPLADLDVVFPKKPWETRAELRFLQAERPDIVHGWKKETAILLEKFYSKRTVGQRLSFLRTLSIAKRFQGYERIWFPWTMDYRGRMYPMPITLNPQGDEVARGLLRFHQRTHLTPGSEGWEWYLVQGANLMGKDKVTFDERRQFIRQNHSNILSSASDPLGSQWWTEADKPWCFLAWAREYHRITSGVQSYTQLPVAMDGRCNGLQHLSMAVRDEQTAALVSLVPSDKPSDIYTTVLNAVEARIPEDSQWKGKVTRKLVKRNTMTTPYNVTKMGMGMQIQEEILSTKENNMLSKDDKLASVELREYNHEVITGLLGRTAQLMQWYNDVSRCYMQEGLRISWVLPDGFRVLQDIQEAKTAKVMLEKKQVVINYRRHTGKQNRMRNIHAMSPNVTHSMDATHMSMVLRTLEAGVPIAAIHDSFGVPAPQVNPLRRAILDSFVELYSTFDIIEAIKEDYRNQTNGKELPQSPDLGNLDVSCVRSSEYAFA